MALKTNANPRESGELPLICIGHPPVVRLDNSALCVHCLARWFPGRSVEWVMSWLERQLQEAVRLKGMKRRREGRQLPLVEGEPGLV